MSPGCFAHAVPRTFWLGGGSRAGGHTVRGEMSARVHPILTCPSDVVDAFNIWVVPPAPVPGPRRGGAGRSDRDAGKGPQHTGNAGGDPRTSWPPGAARSPRLECKHSEKACQGA